MISIYKSETGIETSYYYDQYNDVSTCHINGVCVATLDHNTDNFESYEDIPEEEKDFIYEMMLTNKEELYN